MYINIRMSHLQLQTNGGRAKKYKLNSSKKKNLSFEYQFRMLTAETSKKFLRCISSCTKFHCCLLYLEKILPSFGFYHCSFFFGFLMDFSHFVFHFLSILCLLLFQFFLSKQDLCQIPRTTISKTCCSNPSQLCLGVQCTIIRKRGIDQVENVTSILFRCASTPAFLVFSHDPIADIFLCALT